MPLDADTVKLLACPKCKGALRPVPDPDGLACDACKLLYPIDDGIPNLLADDARPLKS
jgi:uncharacterized protein